MVDSKIDVICPIYFLNLKHFIDNVQSWVRELPINRLIVGMNFDSHNFMIFQHEIEPLLEGIEVIKHDHTKFDTLGACLADLMKEVQTTWFVFVHSDVELTENCYLLMKSFMKPKIGIIESARILYDGENFSQCDHYFRSRPYSGFQLIRKKAIEKYIEIIEDDYIYRNEDFIAKNQIEQAGYQYKKCWAMHYHQTVNSTTWSKPKEKAYDMQWKGLIKYTIPDPITLYACLEAFKMNVKLHGYNTKQILEFAREVNPVWEKAIFDFYLIEMIDHIYYQNTKKA